MKTITAGSTIKIHFDGRLTDGEIFDSTEGADPVMLKIGAGFLIPKFEENLLGLKEGDRRIFTLTAEEAYGPRDESKEKILMRSELPADYAPEIGDILAAEQSGMRMPVRVKSFNDTRIVLDLNHPLAGRDLIYDVRIIEIVAPAAGD